MSTSSMESFSFGVLRIAFRHRRHFPQAHLARNAAREDESVHTVTKVTKQ